MLSPREILMMRFLYETRCYTRWYTLDAQQAAREWANAWLDCCDVAYKEALRNAKPARNK